MTPEQRRDAFHRLATQLWAVHSELEQLLPGLRFDVDRKAVKSILTDLAWANENCTVVGKHQVGEAMDDAMGMSADGTVA
jgi:hypothetical protein